MTLGIAGRIAQEGDRSMFGVLKARLGQLSPAAVFAAAAMMLGACSGGGLPSGDFAKSDLPSRPPQASTAIGSGQIKVGLILPLSATGNAGVAAASMRNAAELALAEFNAPNIQLLVKDDGGTGQGAQAAAQQAVSEGAEIILGPLFAHTVGPVGQVARSRGIPVIAFSNDANVAGNGVYLLSFLPEADVDRIVDYATQSGKRSFAALVPDNAYGSVVEAALNTTAARRGARIVGIQKYAQDQTQMQAAARQMLSVMGGADAMLIPDGGDAARTLVPALGADAKRLQLLGTGLWDDPQVAGSAVLQGGWYATADSSGFRSFAGRYRAKFGNEPVRTATLAYDAVALIAALAKTQGAQRFAPETLTNSSGFTGIDGLFRFRPDGTNQRGLAVLRVTPGGGQVVSPAPRSFGPGS